MSKMIFNFAHRSSNIEHAVWHSGKMELVVCFKSGSNTKYFGVDEETWRGLVHAESAGKYLKRFVIDRCEAIPVDRDGNPL